MRALPGKEEEHTDKTEPVLHGNLRRPHPRRVGLRQQPSLQPLGIVGWYYCTDMEFSCKLT